mmetsp:Transcript_18640/g.38735  ORF Transcript_18640/g.38735 Transcript_18640/m.38735 type:complete len:252 (+) Transcript_18640:214-969(+)|eukprot:CAMPEP_0171330424 /NCGR_PEP_ID=MMETSP0878-20121228/1989_1 /TAXON_ID=67004 /ORGANISM="Thalassiosira weissflogii, Strain CCMP1336" /LENGTH=251 /DNA_ID=CAMNT_0011830705 /DNA_START=156 /DNA_END=911 /DNA_ORIENTATION=-
MDPPVEQTEAKKNQNEASKDSPSASENTNSRYRLLLSVIEKSFTQSHQSIANDAHGTIVDAYGDLTSLFASENDEKGIETLTTLLMGTLERIHDSFTSSNNSESSSLLGKLLQEQNILELLQKVETCIDDVDKTEQDWEKKETGDSQSAKEAIDMARLPVSLTNQNGGSKGKRKLVLPAELLGYHAYQLKLQHHQKLLREISELKEGNDKGEQNLTNKWEEWNGKVAKVKYVVDVLDKLRSDEGSKEGGSK